MVISNINTATYELDRYLAKILSPLSRSEFTVSTSKEFADLMRENSIPNNYKLGSFDVKTLFTNVPLDTAINVNLRRMYKDKEINTNIQSKDMKDSFFMQACFMYPLHMIMKCINKQMALL